MPRPLMDRHELDEASIAPQVEVRRHAQRLDRRVVGMPARVQPVLEEGLDLVAGVAAGRQADTVDHDQVDGRRGWPGIAVRRQQQRRAIGEARTAINRQRRHPFHDKSLTYANRHGTTASPNTR